MSTYQMAAAQALKIFVQENQSTEGMCLYLEPIQALSREMETLILAPSFSCSRCHSCAFMRVRALPLHTPAP